MGGIFGGGGGGGQNTVAPVAAGLRVQTSAYGLCLPLVYGRTRVTGNLIWFGDFTPIAHTTTSGGGGKGGDVPESSNTTWTYTTSFQLGLCEGPIYGIYSGWRDKEVLTQDQINALFTISDGNDAQTPWSYLTSKHPDQALAYRNIAHISAGTYDLGASDAMPNHSFEIGGKFSSSSIGANKPITFTAPAFGVAKTVTTSMVQVGGPGFGGYGDVHALPTSNAFGMTTPSIGSRGMGSVFGVNIGTEALLYEATKTIVLGDKVQFQTTGTMPSGLTANTTYSVVGARAGYIAVATAPDAPSIKIRSLGTGTLTVKKVTFSSVINATANGLQNGQLVNLIGAGIATPFKTNVDYYVVNATTNTIGLSKTLNGTAIVATSSGSGNVFTTSVGSNPRDILVDLLTAAYGARFPSTKIGDLTLFSSFCVANGIFISPAYTDQEEAQKIVADLMELTNCGVYFSEGLLKIVPLSDQDASGNGAYYYATNTPLYNLTDDDFIVDGSTTPVKMNRNSTADAYNQIQVEHLNSLNQYNVEIAEARDQASVDTVGLLTKDPFIAHAITDASVARKIAQMMLQRSLYIRNTFEFTLSWKYCLLEPTDIVTITDVDLGLDNYAVRIVSIEEDDNGQLSVVAEDYPAGVSHSAVYPSSAGIGWSVNYNAAPGDVFTPSFYEVPVTESKTGLAIGVAVTGNNSNWGGCEIWTSYDGTTYKRLGVLDGGSRYGVTSNSITNAAGQVMNVQLSGNGGQLLAGSVTDADNLATLCLVEDELVAYTTAALLGTNQYALTLTKRGQKNTVAASHASAEKFIRMDSALFKGEDLDLSYVGKTIYFKFCSYNKYQGGLQALADVDPYTYTITGAMVKLPPSDVTTLSVTSDASGITFNWTDIADGDLLDYELRKGASWNTAISQGFYGGNVAKASPQVSGISTWLVKARDKFMNYSVNEASVLLTVNAPSAPIVSASIVGENVKLDYNTPASQFSIDHFEIRAGNDWNTATYIGTVGGTTFQIPAFFTGSTTFLVTAIDTAGNIGAPGSANLTVVNPTAPTVTSQVVDNNILLYWNDTHQTLPIKTWEIRKGSTWAGASVIGTKSGLFTTVFETQAGTFTYWVAAIDSAGNYGTPASISATMAQPPDYVLQNDYNSTFTSGTFTNSYKEGLAVVMPVNTTESFSSHFSSHSWATLQAQIDAGYPYLLEPSSTTGSYEETIDYGVTFTSMKITITPQVTVITGTPTMSYTISTSLNGTTWTDYAGVTEVFGTNFRYVKVKAAVSSAGGDDLVKLTALNVRLDVKLKNDAGKVSCVNTDNSAAINSANVGGTTVLFNHAFIAVTSITVSPLGTTPLIAIYDFIGTTVNPLGFKVYLYNTSGSRVSGDVSWSVKGY